MIVTVADVRTYHSLAGVRDEEIIAHLESAKRDFNLVSFYSDDDKKEAICCQTIIYVSPILWARGMVNMPGYETIYSNAGDIETFQSIYQKRIDGVLSRGSNRSYGKNVWGSV